MGENFIAIEKDKITFKAIEKFRYGLLKTISKHLNSYKSNDNVFNSLSGLVKTRNFWAIVL